ncbi:MAG: hypothetical protein WBO10_17010 [Pyrinomonadaceae bacterium]
MTVFKNKFNAMLIMLVVLLGSTAMQASAKDINGYFAADDGGAYFIRQIGNKIYWVGEDPKGGYANIFAGTVTGNKITGKWWDIPKGRAKGGGDLTLEITANGNLTKVTSSAPFGAKTFTSPPAKIALPGGNISPAELMTSNLRSRPEGFRGSNDLTGAWSGDDYATYYIRETPAGDVVWFAENDLWGDPGGQALPSFARVFIGKKIGGLITGNWVDLPKGKALGSGVLGSKLVSQQEIRFNNPPVGIDGSNLQRSLPGNLRGFADLHAHPMVNLAFGGKLIHGGPDVGSILPADINCSKNIRAKNIAQALGPATPTHGSFDQIGCGDAFRRAIVYGFEEANDALVTVSSPAQGYPTFGGYPKWNDIAHQKMWVDWIRRSYAGGQRVMVALATHNATLAAAVSGPGDGPTDDKGSADLQIAEMKAFVGRHNDFMEIAYTPADLRRIVAANKMAVVLGLEIDNIGGFNKMPNYRTLPPAARAAIIQAELNRLHNNGVRYLFPIHVLDNAFGGTAVYEDLFNYSNKREEGHWWKIQCSNPDEEITHKFKPFIGDDVDKDVKTLLSGLSNIKVGLDLNAPKPPGCGANGHRNAQGIELRKGGTGDGEAALSAMMKLGMLIDIDHMSLASVNDTFTLAEAVPGGYPLVSGHTGLRMYQKNENSRTQDQLARIGKLGGMFGMGTDSPANLWVPRYTIANEWIGGKSNAYGDGRVAFGTDLNGLVKGPPPRAGANIYKNGFVKSSTGNRTWDYRKDGVAHYGMLADYREDIRTIPNYGEQVYSSMLKNAEIFARMWEKADKVKGQVK